MISSDLINWLFETKAFRVSPEKSPFWYTSGKIGPFYINTHFLYGNEVKANKLLEAIDLCRDDRLTCPDIIAKLVEKNYNEDSIFKGLIDNMLIFIKSNINLDEIDYISGGERRDWFFSLIVAKMLKKPHISIFKDLSAVLTVEGITKEIPDIDGAKTLHIADLITEASSYERAWIPAIKRLGGEIIKSVVVVDRKQGGDELLAKYGVLSLAMISIDEKLFEQALEKKLINNGQFEMLMKYREDPTKAMKQFIYENPEFIENALNSDTKTAERARLCIEKNFYGGDSE